MDDGGISLTGLTIGGAALTAIGGMVGAWIRARMGRTEITPQPLKVEGVDRPASQSHCDAQHREVDSRTSNLFSRMSSAEQRIAAVEASQRAVEYRLTSMDTKLDTLLLRTRK